MAEPPKRAKSQAEYEKEMAEYIRKKQEYDKYKKERAAYEAEMARRQASEGNPGPGMVPQQNNTASKKDTGNKFLNVIVNMPKKNWIFVGVIIFVVIVAIGAIKQQVSPMPSGPKPGEKVIKPVTSSEQSGSPAKEVVKQEESSSSEDSRVVTPEEAAGGILSVPRPDLVQSMGNLLEVYNDIVFPSQLLVPEPEPFVDKTTVNLGGSYVFRPNGNWACRIDGNQITLVHDKGIAAKFVFQKAKNPIKPDVMKNEIFPAFLEGFGIKDPFYKEIFYNTQLKGVNTTFTSKFNENDLSIQVGMLDSNREILSYVIAWYTSTDIYPEEIIESLLNTITYKSTPVTFAK